MAGVHPTRGAKLLCDLCASASLRLLIPFMEFNSSGLHQGALIRRRISLFAAPVADA